MLSYHSCLTLFSFTVSYYTVHGTVYDFLLSFCLGNDLCIQMFVIMKQNVNCSERDFKSLIHTFIPRIFIHVSSL